MQREQKKIVVEEKIKEWLHLKKEQVDIIVPNLANLTLT